MKKLTELLLEADNQQDNQNNNQNNTQDNQNNQQDDKNKSVKIDAGIFKIWPSFNTTVKGWIKVMSGQEEVKDTFFDGGFLVPSSISGLSGNTQAKTATLSKQLESSCKVAIAEFKNDFMFVIDGLKPYGYVSTGWAKDKGPKIADIIKSMKAEAKPSNGNKNNEGNDNGNNDNGSSGGTM